MEIKREGLPRKKSVVQKLQAIKEMLPNLYLDITRGANNQSEYPNMLFGKEKQTRNPNPEHTHNDTNIDHGHQSS